MCAWPVFFALKNGLAIRAEMALQML